MPYLVPFNYIDWKKDEEEFTKKDKDEIFKTLENLHPGTSWGLLTSKKLERNDKSTFQQLLFMSLYVKELSVEVGDLWTPYYSKDFDEWNDLAPEQQLTNELLIIAASKMLNSKTSKIIQEWLEKPTIGSLEKGVFIISPDQIQDIRGEIIANDYPIEKLTPGKFEKLQEKEIQPWEIIIFHVLGYIINYEEDKKLGVAFSHEEFTLPERTKASQQGLPILKSYLKENVNKGFNRRLSWLFNVRNMPDYVFLRDDREVMKTEPNEAVIVFWHDNQKKWQRYHITYVTSKGVQFFVKAKYPMIVERMFGKYTNLYIYFLSQKGGCKKKNCVICNEASKLAKKMRYNTV